MARTFMSVTNLVRVNNGQSRKEDPSGISPARLAAFEILRRVELDDAYASVLLATREGELSTRDLALSYELTLGVLRWQLTLDHLISHFSDREVKKLDLAVKLALRLGLYQLRFLSRIPASAAVNDSVKLVRFARVRSADKFVNAVLRRATREPDYDPFAAIDDPLDRLAVETSHPRWLIERWSNAFGVEEAAAFARSNNEAPPVSFRITNKSHPSETIEQLRSAGATVLPSEIVENAWRVVGGASLLRQLAANGQIYVQDEASQLVAHAVMPKADQKILDVCAAPGSKTTHIADLVNQALIVAGDKHPRRLSTLVNLSQRLGIGRIYPVTMDGRTELPFAPAVFDRILVDAPCSGTGTLRRNPEIRWRISPADIKELAGQQKQLLINAARALKPFGRLVYSTCSVETEENEGVSSAFLQACDSFVRVRPAIQERLLTNSGAVRTWPHRDGTDGFFIEVFERKN